MKIIMIAPCENGAHENQEVSGLLEIPEGWAIIPDNMEIPDTFPFVSIQVDGNIVTDMKPGVVPEQPVVEPLPTPQEDNDAMLVDHEYRLTLLELGVTEEV
ncbi:hypothetical protein [Evtepia sp.]|uniref:hypothetical protein n=1 Tax=Evtepia sp. TaxID=2773933 RepID=UPI003F160944